MQKTKIIQILKKFSDQEWKDYVKFVDSPFFNKGRSYVPLLKVLRKFRPDFNHPKLSNENIYSMVFKGKPYNNSTFKSMMSGLVSLAEEFLILKGFSKNKRLRNVLLLKELRVKDLYGMYNSHMKNAEKDYVIEGNVDIDFFFELRSFQSEKGYGYLQKGDFINNYYSSIVEMDAVVAGFLLTMFESAPNESISNRIHGIAVRDTLTKDIEKVINFEELLKNLKKNNNRYYEIIALHYNLYRAYKNPGDSSSYYKCRDFLFSNYKLYTERQLFSLFNDIESCIGRLKEQNHEYTEEYNKLYRFMFDKEIFSPTADEYIPLVLFRNVLTYTSISTIEWTDNFVAKYLPKLEPGNRDSMKNFWESQKCLLLKEFQGVIKHAHKIDTNEYYLKIDVKLQYLVAYYELGYLDEARSMIDTFEKHINKNSVISQFSQKVLHNYIAIYKKLLKMKETGDTAKVEKLIKEINTLKSMANRRWLLEKAEELK